jgi:hypothetical protein
MDFLPMNKTTPGSTERAKVALLQLTIGLVMTIASLGFKSIIIFFISIVVLGLGINNIVKLIKDKV